MQQQPEPAQTETEPRTFQQQLEVIEEFASSLKEYHEKNVLAQSESFLASQLVKTLQQNLCMTLCENWTLEDQKTGQRYRKN